MSCDARTDGDAWGSPKCDKIARHKVTAQILKHNKEPVSVELEVCGTHKRVLDRGGFIQADVPGRERARYGTTVRGIRTDKEEQKRQIENARNKAAWANAAYLRLIERSGGEQLVAALRYVQPILTEIIYNDQFAEEYDEFEEHNEEIARVLTARDASFSYLVQCQKELTELLEGVENVSDSEAN